MAHLTGKNEYTSCAVAVRDENDLFLVLSVCRSMAGDVYVNFPRDYEPKWKPHASYHASGQHHQKGFNHAYHICPREKPTTGFHGTENVMTTGIARDEPRAINTPCIAADFDSLFEISLGDLRPEKYHTYLAIDIAEPISPPIIFPGSRVLEQSVFADRVPWIVVTLFDTGFDLRLV